MVVRVACLFAVLTTAGFGFAQPTPRSVVAKSQSPAGTFTAQPPGGTFKTVGAKADLHPADLILSLPGGTLVSKNDAVAVTSLADFDARSPLPILETAFRLGDPAKKKNDVDLELTLERGRVDFTNIHPTGPAQVRLRFWDQNWTITLNTRNTRVAVELCGRWPAGTRFKPGKPMANPGQKSEPVASLVFLVLNGTASVDVGGVTIAMRAPPGPAELQWNSVEGVQPQPQKLATLPPWADPTAGLTPTGKQVVLTCEAFRKAAATDGDKAIEAFLKSPDAVRQRIGLVMLGGQDRIKRLMEFLSEPASLEGWDFAVTVLRHWLGRELGNDQRLYDRLITAGYTEAQSRIIMQLLLGFTPEDLEMPETYEVLIEYLRHDSGAIRHLAAWHLVRLEPQGKQIVFRPTDNAADIRRYHDAWQRLIPSGSLPPSRKN